MSEETSRKDMAIEAAALDWVIRVQREDFADWDALTEWLDGHSDRSAAFDRLSADMADAIDIMHTMPAPPAPPARHAPMPIRVRREATWMRWAAGILLSVGVAGGFAVHRHSQRHVDGAPRLIAAAPGSRQDALLADGTRIALGGGTSVSVDPTGRTLSMSEGWATFEVKHDATHPFGVRVGDIFVSDVGTVFAVHRRGGQTEISVTQGAVRLSGEGIDGVDVSARQGVRVVGRQVGPVQPIEAQDVGNWQRGSLTYADMPVSDVAADLAALTGDTIRVLPAVAANRFAGTIRIAGNAGDTLRSVGPLMGVDVRRQGDAWELGSPTDAGRR